MSRADVWCNKNVRIGDGKAKAVLQVLAFHSDNEGVCWPKQETIADEAEWSLSTVRRALKLLELHNIIQVKRKNIGRQKTVNLYVLNLHYSFDIPGNVLKELGEIKQVQQTPLKREQLDGPVLSGLEDSPIVKEVHWTASNENHAEPVQETALNQSAGSLHTSNRSTETALNRSTVNDKPPIEPPVSTTNNIIEEDGFVIPTQSQIKLDNTWRPNSYIFESLKFSFNIPLFFCQDTLFYFRIHHNGATKKQAAFEKMLASWIRKDWDDFNQLEVIEKPEPISPSWIPSDQALDILASDGISRDHAASLVPSFRLYWLDRGAARPSFGSLFVRFCKWERDNKPQPIHAGATAPNLTDRFARIADRSWAQ